MTRRFLHCCSMRKLQLEKNDIVNGNRIFPRSTSAGSNTALTLPGGSLASYHGDRIVTLFVISFIITASETAYDPQLFDDDVRFWERDLDTQSEDLWDALVLKKSERRVYLKTFRERARTELFTIK